MWNPEQYKYKICDDIDLRIALENMFNMKGLTIENKVKSVYLDSFKSIGREHLPKNPSAKWIQFKDKVFNLETRKMFSVKSDYFFTNPVPWELGETVKTPVMDKLFVEWVGEDKVKMLYELIAYCLYRDYPLHFIFCCIGVGRNGKSKFLQLLSKFVGYVNCTSTELDLLVSSRFEPAKLHKKLVCLMGETNAGNMSKTSMLKKLTGQDMIGFERKNKTPYDDINYAKIVVATNGLPVSEDISEGFYRRWIIIDFPNKFSDTEGDILRTVPEVEYNNLARKCVDILPDLLERGYFDGQESVEERIRKYQLASNPLPEFIKKYCVEDNSMEGMVFYKTFYMSYLEYLKKINKRFVTKREFSTLLNLEGYDTMKTTYEGKNGHFIIGIRLKTFDNIPDFVQHAEDGVTYRKLGGN